MDSEIRRSAMVIAENCVFSVIGGVAMLVFPILRQWWIYALVGPVVGLLYIWIYYEMFDFSQSGERRSQKSLLRGVTIGVTHIVFVSCTWRFVEFLAQNGVPSMQW